MSLRLVSRLHRLLALVIGVQVLFWTASGLFFTLYPIEVVRGEHLIARAEAMEIPKGAAVLSPAEAAGGPFHEATLRRFLGVMVYEIETAAGRGLVDAETGDRISPIGEALARAVVEAAWVGEGALVAIERVDEPPREYGRPGPVWRAEFEGPDRATLYVDASTGELRVVRTPVWRLFDLLWGLHIMDWTSRETFTTWWMKTFSAGALVLTLAGFGLLGWRARRGTLFR